MLACYYAGLVPFDTCKHMCSLNLTPPLPGCLSDAQHSQPVQSICFSIRQQHNHSPVNTLHLCWQLVGKASVQRATQWALVDDCGLALCFCDHTTLGRPERGRGTERLRRCCILLPAVLFGLGTRRAFRECMKQQWEVCQRQAEREGGTRQEAAKK